MAGYPPQYPPPSGPPYGPPTGQDWKVQRRILRDQARAQRDMRRDQMRSMRRGSILGPLLIVVIGVIFLLVQTGRLHSDRLWNWYGHWWPLLLVIGGLILLAEWGIDQARSRDAQVPYARHRVGGGVISILILLAIAGAASSGVHDGHDFMMNKFSMDPDNFEQFLGNKHESDDTLSEQFPAGGSLTVDNPHGDVTITGTSTDGNIHIALHKQVYSRSDTEAVSKARQFSPDVSTKGKIVWVTLPNLNGASGDITLTVPAAAALTINANHGDVHIDKLGAPVTVTANHGDVVLSAISGPVLAHINNNGSSFSAHSVVGPLTLEGHAQDMTISDIDGPVSLSGDFYGTTHLEHITSSVKFHTSRTDFQLARLDGEMEVSSDGISADQAIGPVVLTTANRNVTLERMSGDLAVTNRNGSVDLTSAPPLGNVTVQNRNGSVSLTLPDRSSFAVNAETTDGSIENDFSLPTVDHEQKATMTGTVGKGGPFVRISTSQGDVSFKKASIAPLPVKPPMAPMPPTRPQASFSDPDGSSVYVGKDGVRIISGSDGSSVIVGKDGLKITSNSDGSSTYSSKDGSRLMESSDGSKVYTGKDGTRFTEGADGSKRYVGKDGTRITIGADGSKRATAPDGSTLSETEIRDRLRQADDEIRQTEQQRDAQKRDQQSRREH
jgi:DUF4097 and DUF4098 domain-containing protein YvlB